MRLPICIWHLDLLKDANTEKFIYLQKIAPDEWPDEQRYPALGSHVILSASPELSNVKGTVAFHDQPTDLHYVVGCSFIRRP